MAFLGDGDVAQQCAVILFSFFVNTRILYFFYNQSTQYQLKLSKIKQKSIPTAKLKYNLEICKKSHISVHLLSILGVKTRKQGDTDE